MNEFEITPQELSDLEYMDDFIREIEKPLYVYRMARSMIPAAKHQSNLSMFKSAKTRALIASNQILDVAEKYTERC